MCNITQNNFINRKTSIVVANIDLDDCISMGGLFAYTTKVIHDMNDWDISKIRSLKMCFYKSAQFDQDLPDWDLSSLESNDSIFGTFHGTKITMERIKEWGWTKQRPDLNWELAFEGVPVDYRDDPYGFVDKYFYTPVECWDWDDYN